MRRISISQDVLEDCTRQILNKIGYFSHTNQLLERPNFTTINFSAIILTRITRKI